MPWFPVKKLRKQAKLLLLLLLLTGAAWLSYVHLSLGRRGRALRQPLGYGRGTGGAAAWAGGGGRGGPRAARVRVLPPRPAPGEAQTRLHTPSALPRLPARPQRGGGRGARSGRSRTPMTSSARSRPSRERPWTRRTRGPTWSQERQGDGAPGGDLQDLCVRRWGASWPVQSEGSLEGVPSVTWDPGCVGDQPWVNSPRLPALTPVGQTVHPGSKSVPGEPVGKSQGRGILEGLLEEVTFDTFREQHPNSRNSRKPGVR